MTTVVIPGFSITSLSIARSLTGSDVEIIAIGEKIPGFKMPFYYSKIPTKKILIPPGTDFIQALLAIKHLSVEKPYLMLAEDGHVLKSLKTETE